MYLSSIVLTECAVDAEVSFLKKLGEIICLFLAHLLDIGNEDPSDVFLTVWLSERALIRVVLTDVELVYERSEVEIIDCRCLFFRDFQFL